MYFATHLRSGNDIWDVSVVFPSSLNSVLCLSCVFSIDSRSKSWEIYWEIPARSPKSTIGSKILKFRIQYCSVRRLDIHLVVQNSEKIAKKRQKWRDLDEWMDFKKNPNEKYCLRPENEGEKEIGDYFFISVSNRRGSFNKLITVIHDRNTSFEFWDFFGTSMASSINSFSKTTKWILMFFGAKQSWESVCFVSFVSSTLLLRQKQRELPVK